MRAPLQDSRGLERVVRLELVLAGGQPFQCGLELRRLDLDQEPDVAVVHAEHGHRALRDEPHRAEHRAVAAEGDDQVDACR